MTGLGFAGPGFATVPAMTKDQKRAVEVLKSFRSAMFITQGTSRPGGLHGRPMAVARVEDDGTIYFVTARDSTKVDEMREDSRCLVTMQNSSTYLSASGTGVLGDDEKLDEVWSKHIELWFENGKEDAAVIEFRTQDVEFWDQDLKGLRYAFEAARAAVTGDTIQPDSVGDHEHTRLP